MAGSASAGSLTLTPATPVANNPFVATFTFSAPFDCGGPGSPWPRVDLSYPPHVVVSFACNIFVATAAQQYSFSVTMNGLAPGDYNFIGQAYTETFFGESPCCFVVVDTNVTVQPGFVPVLGLWWNPAESGSGYAIDVKHGVLVMTVFSYQGSGAPQWYLLSAPLVNQTATGKLFKFAGGQCIACAYQLPVASGDDGEATVTFTSATAATLQLPGGRVVAIVPQDF